MTLNKQELEQLVAEQHRDEFWKFVDTGEANPAFLAYLDQDSNCQQALDRVLASQAEAFHHYGQAVAALEQPLTGAAPRRGARKLWRTAGRTAIPVGIAAVLLTAVGLGLWVLSTARQLDSAGQRENYLGWDLVSITQDLYGYRQYYSDWKKAPASGYWYRRYQFKPDRNDTGYTSHFVIYDPNRPGFLFFFNPKAQLFWGRYPLEPGKEPQYSVLPLSERKPKLDEIPESAFPPAGPMPPMPGTEDVTMLPPPPDGAPDQPSVPQEPNDLPSK